MRETYLLGAVALLASVACAPQTFPDQRDVGGPARRPLLAFSLKGLTTDGVSSVRFALLGEQSGSRTVTVIPCERLVADGERATFGPLVPGNYRVQVQALGPDCAVMAAGSASVFVQHGFTSTVEVGLVEQLPGSYAEDGCIPVASPTPMPSPSPTPQSPTGTVVASRDLGIPPVAFAFDMAGSVWAVSAEGHVAWYADEYQSAFLSGAGTSGRGLAVNDFGTAWVTAPDDDAITLHGFLTELGRVEVNKEPWDVAIDGEQRAWVTLRGKKLVAVFAPDGKPIASHRVEKEPESIAIGHDGTVWVTSGKRDCVVRLAADGTALGETTVGERPTDVAVAPDGHAWVACRERGRLFELDQQGRVRSVRGVGAAPSAVATDRNGRVWVANEGDGTVSMVVPAGPTATFRVGGRPTALALDGDGDVWVADGSGTTIAELAR